MGDRSASDSRPRHFWRIGRLVCGLAAVIGMMGAVPAVASAALSISSFTLQNTAGCPPGSTANACGYPGSLLLSGTSSTTNSTVNVMRTGVASANPLGSIGYSLAGVPPTLDPPGPAYSNNAPGANQRSGCVNTSNANATGAGSGAANTVNPVLPRTPGTYTITFTLYSNANCATPAVGSTGASGTVIVTAPAANPSRELKCGLRVALILDESASIRDTAAHPEVTQVREAADRFVSALSDTDSSVAIVGFARAARVGVRYTEVTPQTLGSATNPAAGTFRHFIRNGYFSGITSTERQGTNWQAAFDQIRNTTAMGGGLPDLVVFMTDGDPNGVTGTTSWSTARDGGVDIMRSAVNAANLVKGTVQAPGSRVFAVGVGAAVGSEGSISRLTAVSGPVELAPNKGLEHSDFTTVTHFAELERSLTGLVADICGGTLTITKTVSAPPGVDAERSGWRFRATMTPPPQHVWLTPSLAPPADRGNSASLTTGPDGTAVFHWKLVGAGAATEPAKLSVVKETSKPGFHLVLAQCQVTNAAGDVVQAEPPRTEEPIAEGLKVPPRGHATCAVENTRTLAHLTIIKRLRPVGDPGLFDLLVDGDPVRQNVGTPGGSTRRMALPTGTYNVGERVSADSPTTLADYDTSTRCVNYNGTRPRPTVSGVGTAAAPVPIHLNNATDNWVCWITNVSNRFGNLTVIKHLVPRDAPGAFDLTVNGNVEKAGARNGDRAELTHIPFGDYAVSEAVSAGQSITLADFDISISCVNESVDPAEELPGFPITGHEASVTLSRGQSDIVCTITNVHIPTPVAHLEVVKQLVPSEDAGLFDLRVDGNTFAPGVSDGGSTGHLEFELGTYNVSETAAAGTGTNLANYDISTTCENRTTGKRVHGVGTESHPVSVKLKRDSDNWVCTIRNARKAPPTEPGGGGEEPDLCNDVDNGHPECGDVAAAPRLLVVKQMPTHARVGDRVRVTITVKNVGRATARDVVLHETPPPGGRIVAAGNRGSIQHNGTVLWHLGSLAAGESRTVHATLLITRTGVHTDTAVASASNANAAFDVAAVRARAAARRPTPPPPVVTG